MIFYIYIKLNNKWRWVSTIKGFDENQARIESIKFYTSYYGGVTGVMITRRLLKIKRKVG